MSLSLVVYRVYSVSLVMLSITGFLLGLLSVIKSKSIIVEWEVWSLESCVISMSLVFDWMSLIFFSCVCMISGCIMKYSEYYMEGEKNYLRFVFILLMFVASMWFLILSPNLVSLLIGWDGLGLTSYALVIFYQSESAGNAGMLTVLSNRVGDVAILLGIGLMVSLGDWGFYWFSGGVEKTVAALVVLASMTKSAQMPFSAWLPAAMAAPTPVSALVHSSTLVTAGVYLLIRFSELIISSGMSSLLVGVSMSTMVMAGLGAMFESDMKKIVALSTLSQLGLMIMVLGGGMKELSFFHLITHAMFKSTLFMCAGFMIHSVHSSQDGRGMSGFSSSAPIMGVVLSATNFALCGFPFCAGFYSKDSALEYMFMSSSNLWTSVLLVFGTGLTVAYSFRVLYLSSESLSTSSSVSLLGDMNSMVVKSLLVLFSATLVGGFSMFWVAVPLNEPWYLSDIQKMLVVSVSGLSGVFMFNFVQKDKLIKQNFTKSVESLLMSMWFLPFLSTKGFVYIFGKSGLVVLKNMDNGWLEMYGGQGGSGLFLKNSSLVQKSQTRGIMLSSYILTIVFGIWLFMATG